MSSKQRMEWVWEDHGEAIGRIALSFARSRELDPEEIMGEAQLAFVDAVDRYDRMSGRGRSPLDYYTKYHARNQLHEAARREFRRGRILKRRRPDLDELPCEPRAGVGPVLAELGEDARTVCRLLFDMADVPQRGLKGRLRTALANMGWTLGRIADSFKEITDAIA